MAITDQFDSNEEAETPNRCIEVINQTKCILPYSNCVYCLANKDCSDGIKRPSKKEAKCYRISGKKKMLVRARAQSPSELYEPLYIRTIRSRFENYAILRIFAGEKCIATLKRQDDAWYLVDAYRIYMGNNELDSVEKTLEHLGYYENKEQNNG